MGMEVGEQFMSALSAAWSASDGEGASKEKSRKRAIAAVLSSFEYVWMLLWDVLSDRLQSGGSAALALQQSAGGHSNKASSDAAKGTAQLVASTV